MKEFKNCIVRTWEDKALVSTVLDLAVSAGYSNLTPSKYESICLGQWFTGGETNSTLQGIWEYNINARPGWQRFDARTDMDKLREFLLGIEFDETPLPYDMNKELAEATRMKFNLSQDQWDCLNPMSRNALAGVEVKQLVLPVEWRPASEIMSLEGYDCESCLLCNSMQETHAECLDVGYYAGDMWVTNKNGFIPVRFIVIGDQRLDEFGAQEPDGEEPRF